MSVAFNSFIKVFPATAHLVVFVHLYPSKNSEVFPKETQVAVFTLQPWPRLTLPVPSGHNIFTLAALWPRLIGQPIHTGRGAHETVAL